MVYIITSIIGLIGQSLVLRSGAIKRLFRIPEIPVKHQSKPATMAESVAYLRKWWENKKKEQEAVIRSRRR